MPETIIIRLWLNTVLPLTRLSTGEKLHGPDKDLGAIGQEATLREFSTGTEFQTCIDAKLCYILRYSSSKPYSRFAEYMTG